MRQAHIPIDVAVAILGAAVMALWLLPGAWAQPAPQPPAPRYSVLGDGLPPKQYAAKFMGVRPVDLVADGDTELLLPADLMPPFGETQYRWRVVPVAPLGKDGPVPQKVELITPFFYVIGHWAPPPGSKPLDPPLPAENCASLALQFLPRCGVVREDFAVLGTVEAGGLPFGPRRELRVTLWRVLFRMVDGRFGFLQVYVNPIMGSVEEVTWSPPSPPVLPSRPVKVTPEQARELLAAELRRRGAPEFTIDTPDMRLTAQNITIGELGHPFYFIPVGFKVRWLKDGKSLAGSWYVDAWTGQAGRAEDFPYGKEYACRMAEWEQRLHPARTGAPPPSGVRFGMPP